MISYRMKQIGEVMEEDRVNPAQPSIVVFTETSKESKRLLQFIKVQLDMAGVECVKASLVEKRMVLFTKGIAFVFKTPPSTGTDYGHSLYFLNRLPNRYETEGTYEYERYHDMIRRLSPGCKKIDNVWDAVNIAIIADGLCG